MHDLDKFARMPVLAPTAGQPSLDEQLLIFDVELDVTFKNETYLVRENGEVLRQALASSKRRRTGAIIAKSK